MAENKKRSNKADILKKVRPQEALNMIKSIGLRKRYENILIMRYVDDMSCMDIAQSHTNDIEGTEIDDNIISMNEHFRKYISYKKKYQHRHDEESMSKIMTELEEFLLCMMKILEEMRTSSDFEKEREMIKGKLREMFSLYQEKSN